MLRGDLSNAIAPKVGIRFEAIIYNFGKLNQPGKALAEAILSKDTNLLLITTLPERRVRAWCYKWAIPYTQVVEAAGPLEIPELCFQHKLVVYYDVDDRILEAVGLRGNPRTHAIKWEQPIGHSTEFTD